jgi:lambda repressor-like predicted transcriptional regulator
VRWLRDQRSGLQRSENAASRHPDGYLPTARKSSEQRWPKRARIIAAALGETPQTIRPSRYDREINSPETGPEQDFRFCLSILRLLD